MYVFHQPSAPAPLPPAPSSFFFFILSLTSSFSIDVYRVIFHAIFFLSLLENDDEREREHRFVYTRFDYKFFFFSFSSSMGKQSLATHLERERERIYNTFPRNWLNCCIITKAAHAGLLQVFSLLLGKCGANGVGNTHTHTQCPSVRCVTLVFFPFLFQVICEERKTASKNRFFVRKKTTKSFMNGTWKKKEKNKTSLSSKV